MPPAEMWRALERFDRFEEWWPWFRASQLEGEGITAGSRIRFQIVSPLPHDMSVEAVVTDADRPNYLEADISGDLEGRGRLEFVARGKGTRAKVSWDVEIKHRLLRPMALAARPVLEKSHDWAVRVAVRGFRRHLRGHAA